jgi:hypothetical protein
MSIIDTVRVYTRSKGYSEPFRIKVAEIPHIIHLSQGGLSTGFIDWCDENCAGRWGWFWLPNNKFDNFTSTDNMDGYIGFADKNELTLFCLSNEYIRS